MDRPAYNIFGVDTVLALRFGGEPEIEGKRFAGVQSDLLALGAVSFMPRGDDIMAWGEVGKREAAVLTGNGEMAGLQDDEVAFHPGVNIALDMDELFVIVGIGEGRSAGRLHLVPLAVDLGERVNVVGERIAVGDANFLTDPESQDVGGVVTALLIEKDGCGGNGGIAGVTGGNVDNDVAKGVAGSSDDVFGVERTGSVHFDALGFLGEIQRFGSGGSAGECDFAGDGATGGRRECLQRNREKGEEDKTRSG